MRLSLLLLLLASGSASAADLAKVDRTLKQEPKYAGQPRYGLLVFGAQAKHRVWLVQDGNTLYVDRNGNGDLTEAGEKVTASKDREGDEEGGFRFEPGELSVGGKIHKGLQIGLVPLKHFASNPNIMARPHLAADIKKYPDDLTASITLDVQSDTLKGSGVGGRSTYMISLFDTRGVLRFASKPGDAPIIHLDGPLEVTFFAAKPTWTAGRSQDTVLCVGTPGHGPGTFAMLKYEGTIPPDKHPKIEATYSDSKPVKELYELKERC